MAITQKDKELIERFLDNDLAPQEAVALKERISNDIALSEAYEMQKKAIESLKSHESLKDELREIFDEVKKEKLQPVKKSYAVYWLAAASLALIATIAFFFTNSEPDNKQLYFSYYKPLAGHGVTRDESKTQDNTTASQAMAYYQKQKFKEAIPLFEELIASKTTNDKNLVYLANCYLNTDQLSLARKSLDTAMKSSSSFTRQQAQWYLALLELRQGHMQKARASFEKIHHSQGVYEREAKSLLEELN